MMVVGTKVPFTRRKRGIVVLAQDEMLPICTHPISNKVSYVPIVVYAGCAVCLDPT